MAIDPMEPVRGSDAEDEPERLFSDSSPGPDEKRDEAATPSSPLLAPRDVGTERHAPWLTYTPREWDRRILPHEAITRMTAAYEMVMTTYGGPQQYLQKRLGHA